MMISEANVDLKLAEAFKAYKFLYYKQSKFEGNRTACYREGNGLMKSWRGEGCGALIYEDLDI